MIPKLAAVAALVASSCLLPAQNVLTRSYDNFRSGANPNETILTTANVGGGKFGKLFSVKLDGEVYAQPLFVSNFKINGGTHNVVYVATMNNSVYALDGDTGTTLWHVTHGTPIVSSEVQDPKYPNINAASGIGILSTPVIDLTKSAIYYVHGNEAKSGSTSTYSFYLEALDLATGSKILPETVISGTYNTADLASPLVFNAQIENQRSSLALANGNIYIAFASHNDLGAYHGWVFAYNQSNFNQVAVYADTTVGTEGGIWQAGAAPAVDENGNIYYSTGNGSFHPRWSCWITSPPITARR
jgi:outer membrane protein assembly factor BamB